MKSIRRYLLASFVFGIVLSVIAHVHSGDDSGTTPVIVVWRRQSHDIYTILQQDKTEEGLFCHDNETYLVKESQCVDNYYLFNGNL